MAAGLEIPLAGRCEFAVAVGCSLMRTLTRARVPSRWRIGSTTQPRWVATRLNGRIRFPLGDSPSPERIDDVYRTSLYVIRCHQHPILGGITVGSYPDMWNSCVCPSDMSFGLMALLGAND